MGKSPADIRIPDIINNEIREDEQITDLPIGEFAILKNGDIKKLASNEDTFGYNQHALKIYMAMAGYKPNFGGLQLVLGLTKHQAVTRMIYGKFTRHDLAVVQYRLNLSPQQMAEVFFNGHYQHDIVDPDVIEARTKLYQANKRDSGVDIRDVRKPATLNKELLKNSKRKLR